MKTHFVTSILASISLLSACNRAQPPTTDSDSRVQAEPFNGQVYRSHSGRSVLTLISRDECELHQNGRTLLCKYTKQADALRVLLTAMGTNQVVYYRFTDHGIQGDDGSVLLSPKWYEVAVEQERIAEDQRQKAREEEERREQLAIQQHKQCVIPTREIARFVNSRGRDIIITDTNVLGDVRLLDFKDVLGMYRHPVRHFYIEILSGAGDSADLRSADDRDAFASLLDQSIREWQQKYPAVQSRYKGATNFSLPSIKKTTPPPADRQIQRSQDPEVRLNELYARLREKLTDAEQANLKVEQLKWLEEREKASPNQPQYIEITETRIKELEQRLDR